MIYEDAATGAQAKEFCDRFIRTLDRECHLNSNIWSFPVLRIPEIRNIAASAAAAADIVIFAATGKQSLPRKIEDWVEMWAWLLDRARPALVSVIADPEAKCAGEIRSYLKKVAKGNGLAFFAGSTFATGAARMPEPAAREKESEPYWWAGAETASTGQGGRKSAAAARVNV